MPTSSNDDNIGEVTRVLGEIEAGRMDSAQLLPMVYRELRRLASARMQNEAAGHSLQPTALVHEAYLRLLGDEAGWESRGHFFAAAAEAMRRILVESARRKARKKYGGAFQQVELNHADAAVVPRDHHDLLALDAALEDFFVEHPDKAELVKLRYFAGLTEKQAAEILGVSRATAARWWMFSKAWLKDRMGA